MKEKCQNCGLPIGKLPEDAAGDELLCNACYEADDCDNCGTPPNANDCIICERKQEVETPPAPAPKIWKVSTTYKRAQNNKADIISWDNQSEIIAKNIKKGDAELICRAVNKYFAEGK